MDYHFYVSQIVENEHLLICLRFHKIFSDSSDVVSYLKILVLLNAFELIMKSATKKLQTVIIRKFAIVNITIKTQISAPPLGYNFCKV